MIDPWLLAFSALVFPGLLFVFAASLLAEYFVRKIVARAQRRVGPKYTGPIGLLQPFADFFKLLVDKELVIPRHSMPRLAEALLVMAVSALSASMLLFPLSPFRISSPFDLLIFVYFTCVLQPLLFILACLSMPGPYTSVGVSRMLTMVVFSEPAFFASLLVPGILSSGRGDPLSITSMSINAPALWANPLTAPLMALSLLSAVVALQARSMMHPFNVPDAEQEIIAGFATEFSGPLLALERLLHDADYLVTSLAVTYILLGGPYPYPHSSLLGALLLIVKLAAVILATSAVRASFGRLRIEQALDFLVKYSLLPSALSVILAGIYVWA